MDKFFFLRFLGYTFLYTVSFLTIGLLLFSSFEAAIFLPLIAVGFYFYFKRKQKETEKKVKSKYEILSYDDEYTSYLLLLIAAVIQSDGKNTQPEYFYVRKTLSNFFPEKRVNSMMEFIQKSMDKGQIDVKKVCYTIRNSFDVLSKIELLHLLVSIATIDNVMMDKELEKLKAIAKYLRIPYRTFQSVINMFRFRREGHQKTRPRVSKNKLKEAFKILEIPDTATVKQIKKAYRKLALKYHPDRLVHKDEAFIKSAEDKFQVISDAYEYIKTRKGFA